MHNQLKTLLLLGVISAILVALGGYLGNGWLYGAIAFALFVNVGSYWFSDRIVLAMSRARELPEPAHPRLHAMVAELAGRAGLPKPRVYLIPDAQPNAFATGRSPEHGVVAVTEGILRLLDERELRGVLAHELAHIRNRDILIASVAAVLATAISSIANLLQWSVLLGGGRDEEGGSPLGALALAIVAPVAATLVQYGISRQREYLADAAGARICGDPEALARALLRLHEGARRVHGHAQPATASLYIVNPFGGVRGLVNLFSTHPPVEERVARLLAMAAR